MEHVGVLGAKFIHSSIVKERSLSVQMQSFFPLALLRYNRHITLCKFKVKWHLVFIANGKMSSVEQTQSVLRK